MKQFEKKKNSAGFYVVAAKILDSLFRKQGTIKGLVHSDKSQVDKKLLYALVCETLKYNEVLTLIIEKSDIKEKPLLQSKGLLHLLVYDLLFGKGVRNGSAANQKQLILKHKARLNAELVKLMIKRKVKDKKDLIPDHIRNSIVIPRYVRVNTLKTTLEDAVKHFQMRGYKLGEFEDIALSDPFPSMAFCIDAHLPNMLLLPPNADLHQDELLINGSIILQDKASCFPAYILSPPLNSICIDGCAAPGNKTSHLSMIMKNTGKIYAFDMDRRRLDTLERLTTRAGCSNITPVCGSFLEVNPKDKKYKNVEYILLDPSCSGSGIVGRMDHLTSQLESEQVTTDGPHQKETEEERVDALAEFQKEAILHAFTFPSVKRVVYSTCSKHKQENEMVVDYVLKKSGKFRLVENVFPQWKRRGMDVIDGSQHVIRTLPEKDKTIGFFVALFERI